jgi:hypothetical protein
MKRKTAKAVIVLCEVKKNAPPSRTRRKDDEMPEILNGEVLVVCSKCKTELDRRFRVLPNGTTEISVGQCWKCAEAEYKRGVLDGEEQCST